MRKITLLLFLVITAVIQAQIINAPPYTFSIDEFKTWTSDGPLVDDLLIADEPLRQRFENSSTQFNSDLSNDMEIAFLPDGMSNFANYGEEQSQFNLYNFTNWSYIDKIVWFGGTSDQTVSLPSAPWVNAAHKNGVKVLANIFLAPVAFGGSTATVNNFLEQDGAGDFVILPAMIESMEYYGFDGWFVNQETSTTPATAQVMRDFMEALTEAVEALGKEVMWYDAMLLSGNVGWQNRLNANNSVFVQDDEDGDSSNGFETRVSSSIFINFFWNSAAFTSGSRTRATTIGRSSFDVFTGVDVWPGRNQSAFEAGGNNWMSLIHEDPTTPYTSLGLFAPNCVFNNNRYSVFNTDPTDYANFYSEDRHMFAGADRNPRLEDATGFKGYANWIPAASTITDLPFETNFNTGHGLAKFEGGDQVSTNPWHNMDVQDVLPTWQFAFSENDMLTAVWDFGNAYNGGNSLRISGDLAPSAPIDLLLYKTELLISADTKLDVFYNQTDSAGAAMIATVTFVDSTIDEAQFFINTDTSQGWTGDSFPLIEFIGEEIATIGLRFLSENALTDYGVNIGQIKVHNGQSLAIPDQELTQNTIRAIYSPDGALSLHIEWPSAQELNYEMYAMDGKLVARNSIDKRQMSNFRLSSSRLASGIYLVNVTDGKSVKTTKVIVK